MGHCQTGTVSQFEFLFPLYSGWGLAGDIVDHAVYPGYFIDDAAGDASQEVIGETSPISGHSILAGNGAYSHQITISPIISHNTYTPDIGENSKALP